MLMTCLGLWLLFNLYFNYFFCMWAGPGHVPATFQEGDPRIELLYLDPCITAEDRQKGMRYRYCQRCKVIKGLRTHHCSACNKCVLKMDHHCPWINGCVGFQNYRPFLLFLLYLWASTLFVLLTSSHKMYKLIMQPMSVVLDISGKQSDFGETERKDLELFVFLLSSLLLTSPRCFLSALYSFPSLTCGCVHFCFPSFSLLFRLQWRTSWPSYSVFAVTSQLPFFSRGTLTSSPITWVLWSFMALAARSQATSTMWIHMTRVFGSTSWPFSVLLPTHCGGYGPRRGCLRAMGLSFLSMWNNWIPWTMRPPTSVYNEWKCKNRECRVKNWTREDDMRRW